MHTIKTFDRIDREGLKILEGAGMFIGPDVKDPRAILVRSSKINTADYPMLLAVARAGAGVDKITVDKATSQGVCVFNTPGQNANAVAELVFAVLGAFSRRLFDIQDFMRKLADCDLTDDRIAANVEASKADFKGFELAGKRLCVIGLGKIGVLVANGGNVRGMKVVAYDASPTIANIHELDRGVRIYNRIDDALARADIVSVHVPLCAETKHLMNMERLKLLEPGAVVMNYSREGIYDDDAVCKLIADEHLAAYLTDFPTSALLGLTNIWCTSHAGASTVESEEKCAVMAATQLREYLLYGTVSNSVNFPVMEKFIRPQTKIRLAVVNHDQSDMVSKITGVLGEGRVNIQSSKNESNGRIGYNLIDLEQDDLPDEIVGKIAKLPGVIGVRKIMIAS